jgi:hypothetical protein
MDTHVNEFFRQSSDEAPRGNFYRVVALHDAPDIDWKEVSKKVPALSRGWFELAHLPTRDRIEFSRDYWLNKLPYKQGFSEFLVRFFDAVDDIGVYITQQKFDDSYEACLVYNMRGNTSFYRGGIPASEESINRLQKLFPDYLLPTDYRAFLQIHDGFWKTTDCTGIIRINQMEEINRAFQEELGKQDRLLTSNGVEVNPKSLIAFYKSFGMPFFQCFWGEWYPEGEMGNIYYSDLTKSITFTDEANANPENLAFPTFLDWLMFYLEKIA